MPKSLKILAGVIVVAAIAWPAAAWYTGKRAEEVLQQQAADINTRLQANPLDANFKVEIADLTRGVFSTQAHLRVVYHSVAPDAAASPDQTVLVLRESIYHGPFPLNQPFSLAMASITAEPENSPAIKPWFDAAHGGVPFTGAAVVHYGGAFDGSLTLKPIDFTSEGFAAKFSGGKVNFSKSGSNGRTDMHGNFDALQLALSNANTGETIASDMTGMTLEGWSRQGASGLGIGDAQISARQIKLTHSNKDAESPALPPVTISDVTEKLSLGENESGGMLSGRLDYQLGMINVAGKDLAGVSISLIAKNLATAPIKSLAALYGAVSARTASTLKNKDPEQAQEALESAMSLTPQEQEQAMAAGMALLAGKPSIVIDPIQVQNAKGQGRLTVQINLAKPNDDAQGLDKIAQTIPGLEVKLNLSTALASDLLSKFMQLQGVNAEVADQQANRQVISLGALAVLEGYAVQENNQIVSSLRIAGNTVNINGKEIPLTDALSKLPGPIGNTGNAAPDNDAPDAANNDALDTPDAANGTPDTAAKETPDAAKDATTPANP